MLCIRVTIVIAMVFACAACAQAQRLAGDLLTPREAIVVQALAHVTSVDIEETSLREFIEYLEQLHAINVFLDVRALDDLGIGSDTSVTIRVADLPLHMVLDRILKDIDEGLTWSVDDEALVITTREAADANLHVWLYDVSRLVPNYEPIDFDQLINVITTAIEPDSWEDVGGVGAIVEFEGPNAQALVISHSFRTHQKIAKLLSELHRLAGHVARLDICSFGQFQWSRSPIFANKTLVRFQSAQSPDDQIESANKRPREFGPIVAVERTALCPSAAMGFTSHPRDDRIVTAQLLYPYWENLRA